MRKRDELADPSSCLNKAKDDEWLFVLLGRDAASPATVVFWVSERIRLGKNTWDDPQIKEALRWAEQVRQEASRGADQGTQAPPPAAVEAAGQEAGQRVGLPFTGTDGSVVRRDGGGRGA